MHDVRRMTAQQLDERLSSFVALIQDAVNSGASIGFLPPLEDSRAREYWGSVRAGIDAGNRILLAVTEQDEILGAVQLDLASMPNAQHRAEVMKLMVRRVARRRGIGRALMRALEHVARQADRHLLVLDTRVGDPAEQLYLELGFKRAGVIPHYAMSATGTLEATVYMYRELRA